MPFFTRKTKEKLGLVPPATLAPTFAAGWEEVVRKYAPPTPEAKPQVIIDVAKAVADWVRHEVRPETRGFSEGDLYASALLLGAFCLFAAHREETPYLVTRDKRVAELPLLSGPYTQGATNSTFRITVPHAVQSADTWVRFDGGHASWLRPGGGGPETGDLVHAGVHILGAMTQLPEGSGVIVRPQHDTGPTRPSAMVPPINVAGAPPFPSDVSLTFLQPRQ